MWPQDTVRERAECPRSLMGRVFARTPSGKGSVAALESRTECRISVDDDADPCGIEVCGSVQQVGTPIPAQWT